MRPPILITGCARSGTSATAGIFDKCGAFGGHTFGPNQWNRKGMFENCELREQVLKNYLRLIGADPKGQKPLPRWEVEWDANGVDYSVREGLLPPVGNLRSKMETTMKFHGYKHGPWYYKGAKMCLIWPIFHHAFPDATWVIVRRRIDDNVYSCLRTAFMSAYRNAAGWKRWAEEHHRRFDQMRAHPGLRVYEVWPRKFIRGDFKEVRTVVEQCGLTWNEKKVCEFVDPQLWRGKDDGK